MANFSNLTGEGLMSWEVTALVQMNEALQKARNEGPPLEPLTMDAFDAFFNPGG